MKFSFATLILTFSALSAQAFITNQDRDRLIAHLNQSSSTVTLTDIRCFIRQRSCLVKMDLKNSNTKIQCMIEKINGPADIIAGGTADDGTLALAEYAGNSLNECIANLK